MKIIIRIIKILKIKIVIIITKIIIK